MVFEQYEDYSEDYSEWRMVRGFPNYEITRDGRIRNHKRGGLKYEAGRDGSTIKLNKEGKTYHLSVRLLVLKAFPEMDRYR